MISRRCWTGCGNCWPSRPPATCTKRRWRRRRRSRSSTSTGWRSCSRVPRPSRSATAPRRRWSACVARPHGGAPERHPRRPFARAQKRPRPFPHPSQIRYVHVPRVGFTLGQYIIQFRRRQLRQGRGRGVHARVAAAIISFRSLSSRCDT